MTTYNKIVKKLFKRHAKFYMLKHDSVFVYLTATVSYYVTPIFIFLKFTPNSITFLNFLISLLSLLFIISLDENLFCWGIFLYYTFRVFDFCDGNVARYYNISSFYGRFLDSILDIFFESFLILSISFFIFQTFGNETLFFIGIVASIFAIYGSCIFDKYSALARWSNEENKTKIIPYLRKVFYPRIGYTLVDIVNFGYLTLPFLLNNKFYFETLALIIFFTFIISGIQNIIKHIIFAKKNFENKAKDKKTYHK